MYQCHSHLHRLKDAARGSASPGRHGRQQRHKEGSTRATGGLREVCGFAWVCMGFEFVVLGWGRESSAKWRRLMRPESGIAETRSPLDGQQRTTRYMQIQITVYRCKMTGLYAV